MIFLIAGLGSIGRRHLRNLLALGQKDIVLLRSHKSTLPEEELDPFQQETDLQIALEKHTPDAVIVSNPSALHLDIAIPAADAGCAILLEKPVSSSMDRMSELRAAVEKFGAKVLMGFQFRFHPALIQAKKVISAGAIGRILSAHVHFGEYLPAWHPWEDYRRSYAARSEMGGGVLLTQCHSLDYLPWLIEKKVQSVWGFAGKLGNLDINVDDTAQIGLRFEGGILGGLHLNYNQQPPVHRLEVIGTGGSLWMDFSDGIVHVHPEKKETPEIYPLPTGWERNAMFLEEMSHFVSVVKGEQEPQCRLDDGIRVQQLVQAVQESQSSRSMVDINI